MPFDGAVPTYVCNTAVKAGKAAAFERHVREVIVPAVAGSKLDGDWTLLKPASVADDAASTYCFLFYGSATLNEWDLEPFYVAALGEDAGKAALAEFMSLIDGQTVWEYRPGL